MGAESFSWVVEGVVGGMSRPGLIMEVAEDLAHLRTSCNIGHVVSLTESPLDPRDVEQAGVVAHHFPVPDFTPPSPETIAGVVEVVERAKAAGQAVVIHCAAGLGRTGTLLACVLVREGLDATEAIQRVRQLRPGSVETAEQEHAVRAYAARLAEQRKQD